MIYKFSLGSPVGCVQILRPHGRPHALTKPPLVINKVCDVRTNVLIYALDQVVGEGGLFAYGLLKHPIVRRRWRTLVGKIGLAHMACIM